MHSRHVEIKSPCHESWDAMHGDDARRFCDVCAKDVHNLSAMAREEAEALLQAHRGEHLCVRYSSGDDGAIAFRQPVIPSSRLRVARSAFAAVMLAACTPHGEGPPIQELGEAAIESLAPTATPDDDGGCSVQTGPLTTLHFPAGHKVCEHLADRGDRIAPPAPPPPTVQGGISAPPIPPAPPPPTVEQMGAVAPEPRQKMGEMVPELKEPCDPTPTYAPPPPPTPPAPPAPPTTGRMLMGDIAAEPPPPPPVPSHAKMGKIKSPKN